MSPETKEFIKIVVRGVKYTIAMIEKWLRGEPT